MGPFASSFGVELDSGKIRVFPSLSFQQTCSPIVSLPALKGPGRSRHAYLNFFDLFMFRFNPVAKLYKCRALGAFFSGLLRSH